MPRTASLVRLARLLPAVLCAVAASPSGALAQGVGALDDARAIQQDAGHTGALLAGGPELPLRRRWTVELEDAGNPLIADGKVFVVATGPSERAGLLAFDGRDGGLLWRAGLPQGARGANAVYDAGRVYVSGAKAVRAFDAATGKALWRTSNLFPTDEWPLSAPVATGGFVYVGDSSGMVVLRATDGSRAWHRGGGGQQYGAPAVARATAWMTVTCGGAFGVDVALQTTIRNDTGGCNGGGIGSLTVNDGEQAVTRGDFRGGSVWDARTGAFLSALPSDVAPAVGHGRRYALSTGTLRAVPRAGGAPDWAFTGDGSLAGMPLVVGDHVFATSARGWLYALEPESGRRAWARRLDAPVRTSTDDDEARGMTGMAAGEGLLIVPTELGLEAFESGGGAVVAPDEDEPETSIAPIAGPLRQRDPLVAFSADEAGATFDCRLDGSSWVPCSSPHRLVGLADGEHRLEVRATDAGGLADRTPALAVFAVDAPPDTLMYEPSSPTRQAELTFWSEDQGARFECRIDGGAWAACTSPARPELPEGEHSFAVRAIDAAGQADATPAEARWTVDTTPPRGFSLQSPADGTVTSSRRPRIAGTADPDGRDVHVHLANLRTYQTYTWDVAPVGGRWEVDLSDTAPLREDEYRLSVSQGDPGGWAEAQATFRVTLEAPDTDFGYSGPPVTRESKSLWLEASRPVASFQCRQDGGEWFSCPQPLWVGGGDGEHLLEARAVDGGGAVDPTPAEYRWTVDTTAPRVTAHSPSGTTADPTPRFSGTAGTSRGDEDTVLILIRGERVHEYVAAEVAGDGSWAVDAPPLPDGDYDAYARQEDWAGNEGGREISFSVASPEPDTTLARAWPRETPTRETDASFEFTSTKPDGTFECSLDGAGWSGCRADHIVVGLGDGRHELRVRAVSPAGVADPEPAVDAWTVDATEPVLGIDTPADRTRTEDRTPAASGAVGTAAGDREAVGIRYRPWGSGETHYASATVVDGRWSGEPEEPLPPGIYEVTASQGDAVGNFGTSPTRVIGVGMDVPAARGAGDEPPAPTPTVVPTVEPTVVPTVEPTVVPTVEPTATPTPTPTAEPTATASATPVGGPAADASAGPHAPEGTFEETAAPRTATLRRSAGTPRALARRLGLLLRGPERIGAIRFRYVAPGAGRLLVRVSARGRTLARTRASFARRGARRARLAVPAALGRGARIEVRFTPRRGRARTAGLRIR